MTALTIEINGTGTHNRGAELMAIAAAASLRARFPEARLVVPSRFGTRLDIRRHGFLTTPEFTGLRFARMRTFAASRLWRQPGDIIDPARIDVVLDASGFAFSDQWGPERAHRLAMKMAHAGRRHQPLILLPQALGPFDQPVVARWCHAVFSRAAMICARDEESFANVARFGDFQGLRRYPDFTVGIEPAAPASGSLPSDFCAIVPNRRMLDKTGAGASYLGFLARAIRTLRARRLNPVFLLHDAEEDRRVIGLLREEAAGVKILTHADPRVLKGMLGRATIVIGSRYHALVSALSQGVPCIVAGWSHKYPQLLRDFSSPDLLMEDLTDKVWLDSMIERLADPAERHAVSVRILAAARKLKQETTSMWQEVEYIIGRIRHS